MTAVPFDDLEPQFPDETIFDHVWYQGRPFTGVAIDAHADSIERYPFVAGRGHGVGGRWTHDGVPLEEVVLDQGAEVEARAWDRATRRLVRYGRRTPRLERRWSPHGVLIEEQSERAHLRWFADAGLRYRALGDTVERFVHDGRLACTRPRQLPSPIFADHRFDDAVMAACLDEILDDPAWDHDLYGWIHARIDRGDAAPWLARLIDHRSLHTASAIAIIDHRGLRDLAPLIEAVLDDARVPPPRVRDGTTVQATRSFADDARLALARLRDR